MVSVGPQLLTPQKRDGQRVYRHEGELQNHDGSTFISYRFLVPRGTREIQISFGYHPVHLSDDRMTRELVREAYREYAGRYLAEGTAGFEKLVDLCLQTETPLSNVVRLYLHTNTGKSIGEWRPQSKDRSDFAWITSEDSSRGLKRTRITPGLWRAEIYTGKVMTQTCRYQLEIRLLERAVSSRSAETPLAAVSPPAKRFACRGWYSGQLHAHSTDSDGQDTVPQLAAAFKATGADFFALTDHNTISGWQHAPRHNEILLLRGIEIGATRGHGVGLGIRTHVDWRNPEGDLKDINQVIREVHRQGGVFSIAHHFAIGESVCDGCRWNYPEVEYGSIDLMEVWWHPWVFRKVEAYRCFALWNELLNRGLRITGISSIDCHDTKNSFAFSFSSMPKTYVFAEKLAEKQIIAGLKKGHVFASSGPRLYFTGCHGGRSVICGDEIRKTDDSPVRFEATLEGLEVDGLLKVICNGVIQEVVPVRRADRQVIRFSESNGKSGGGNRERSWYRCEVYQQADGEELVCFANPIYVRKGGGR